MTREEARQAAEVMMAYAEGREVEYYDVIDECWDSSGDLGFNWFDTKYRVKPETKYRPFKNKEECWNEMMKHQPFGWVVDKFYNFYHIGVVYSGKKETYGVRFYKDDANYDYEYMLKEYKFADGAPFGVMEE